MKTLYRTHTILSVHGKDARRRFCFYLKHYIWLKVKETVTFCLWVCMVFRKILRKENQRIHVPPVSVVNLQTCFSVLCRRTPPHECNIAWADILILLCMLHWLNWLVCFGLVAIFLFDAYWLVGGLLCTGYGVGDLFF